MIQLLRFVHLQERGLVKSRVQLKRLQQFYGFPLGRLVSPNVRTWTEEEIDSWYASRPVHSSEPLRGAIKTKHERRIAKLQEAEAEAEP